MMIKEQYLEERVKNHAELVAEQDFTIREVAQLTKWSKSTVQKDLEERLKKINYSLYLQVRKVLERHTEERSINGGLATQRLYAQKKQIERGITI